MSLIFQPWMLQEGELLSFKSNADNFSMFLFTYSSNKLLIVAQIGIIYKFLKRKNQKEIKLVVLDDKKDVLLMDLSTNQKYIMHKNQAIPIAKNIDLDYYPVSEDDKKLIKYSWEIREQ